MKAMKKITLVISLLSVLIAVLAIVLNFRVIFGRSYFIGFAMFSMIRSGSFMGYIGNLLGMLVTALAFAAMGLYGLSLTAARKESARRPALISGAIVGLLALVSLIFSIANHRFNFGDIMIVLFPAAYLFCVIQTVED